MSAQHTPGPWVVKVTAGETFIRSSDGANVSRVGAATNMRANARLIAAAPDLLAALKAVCSHGTREPQQISSDWDAARAAIARAEGGAA